MLILELIVGLTLRDLWFLLRFSDGHLCGRFAMSSWAVVDVAPANVSLYYMLYTTGW